MILLMLTKDNEIIKEYMLQDDIVTIGRDQRNSMQIDDPNVADQHLRLVYRFLTWQLEDLSNGTRCWITSRWIRPTYPTAT